MSKSIFTTPDWPPQATAIGVPNGTRRHGSTGQLFEAQDGRWVRVAKEDRPREGELGNPEGETKGW